MTTDTVVETERLCVGYLKVPVASNIDITVQRGEIVALLGRNGAGKTTILNTLAGLLRPVSGKIFLNGGVPPKAFHQRVRSGLAFVTERRAIIRRLTVLENLRLGRGSPEVAFQLFPELTTLVNRRGGLLSGGEQQMLAIGKLMAQRPSLLLVDELSLGLAPLVVERLTDALRFAAAEGVGVLLVEQQATTALTVADRAYVLAGGGIRMSGTGADLASRVDEIEDLFMAN
jgi:branched-chain amino acid transport system ATP-binding protein